jgi:hypothetical protein
MNGSYATTLFVCLAENIYVNFPCITLIRRDVDFKQPITCDCKNIVFDSRLELTILYNFLINPHEILVYDIYKHKIYSVHLFLSEKYCINPYSANQVFAICYLILHHYFDYLNFKNKNLVGKNVIDVLINAIGPQHHSEYNTDNVNATIEFFNSLHLHPKPPKVNRYEFYIALTLLKNSNWKYTF